jgi:hypothetical protein
VVIFIIKIPMIVAIKKGSTERSGAQAAGGGKTSTLDVNYKN